MLRFKKKLLGDKEAKYLFLYIGLMDVKTKLGSLADVARGSQAILFGLGGQSSNHEAPEVSLRGS